MLHIECQQGVAASTGYVSEGVKDYKTLTAAFETMLPVLEDAITVT